MNDLLPKVGAGTWQEPSRNTLAKFLREEWLPVKANRVRPSTLAQYRSVTEHWIIPEIGGVELRSLTPKHIEAMVAKLQANGSRLGRGGLSGRSAGLAPTVLRMALARALEHGLVIRNVAAMVKRPRSTQAEMSAWTADEARAFLSGVVDDRLAAAWMLFLARGLRRGEVAGLR